MAIRTLPLSPTASYSYTSSARSPSGFPYAPQLANLPDQKMWRIDRTADYGAFQDAARGRIDLTRIERHGEVTLRIVGSIHTGAVRAYDVKSGTASRFPQAGAAGPS